MTTIRTLLAPACLTFVLLGVTPAVQAQDDMGAVGRGSGFGIGYNALLTGPSGISAVYDAGMWHADAILGISGGDETDFDLGVRGFYHLHSTAMSDFSLGGGFGITHNDFPGPAESSDVIHIEIGLMIRAFLTANVSINGFAGLGVLAGDADGFVLDAQPLAGLGFTYFFF